MSWKRALALVVASVGVLAPLGVASAKPAAKVDICHYDEYTGTYKLINISANAVPAHLRNHPDGFVGDAVPGMRGFIFGPACAPVSQIVTIGVDDVVYTGEFQLGLYAGFSWTKSWVYQPGVPDPYGYQTASAPNTGFIGFPQDLVPLRAVSTIGDVSFTSMFLSNPTGSATDPDGPITITIEAWDDGAFVASQQVVLADGAGTTVPLTFDSVDELRMSANGKYFAFDDLAYFPA